jgi:hypothetical protein
MENFEFPPAVDKVSATPLTKDLVEHVLEGKTVIED